MRRITRLLPLRAVLYAAHSRAYAYRGIVLPQRIARFFAGLWNAS